MSASGRAVSRGRSGVVWSGWDEAGVSVPPGTYQVEVVAVSESGEVARAVCPVVITR